MVASAEAQIHGAEGEVGRMRGLFAFIFILLLKCALVYQMLVLEFSLKIQLCMCMHVYTLFMRVRSMRSKSLLEEPMVLDKSSACVQRGDSLGCTGLFPQFWEYW